MEISWHSANELSHLYKADALEFLSSLQSESVDCVWTDPPYFLSNDGITCVAGKLHKMLVVSRISESKDETRSLLHGVTSFMLDDPDTYATFKADYDLVRNVIREQGFGHLTGHMGTIIQPRTKDSGYGSTSRAFYARTQFVAALLGL